MQAAAFEEVLEVALGLPTVAMASEAVAADELGEGGLDAGPGLQPGTEGGGLRLGPAGPQALVVLGEAEVAAPGTPGALGRSGQAAQTAAGNRIWMA